MSRLQTCRLLALFGNQPFRITQDEEKSCLLSIIRHSAGNCKNGQFFTATASNIWHNFFVSVPLSCNGLLQTHFFLFLAGPLQSSAISSERHQASHHLQEKKSLHRLEVRFVGHFISGQSDGGKQTKTDFAEVALSKR